MQIDEEVICIDDSYRYRKSLNKGNKYTIKALRRSPCGHNIQADVGILASNLLGECSVCKAVWQTNDVHWYKISRFAPIDTQDISELTEILEKEVFKL